MKTLHLVWNKGRNECVGFLDKADADWTAYGGRHPETDFTPTLGEEFRDLYGESADVLFQTTVEVPE